MGILLKKLLTKSLGRFIINNTLSANNSLNNDSYVLTAIVLVYNGERYLQECLNSLVNQTLDNLEILLINDASTDDSLSICKRYESYCWTIDE